MATTALHLTGTTGKPWSFTAKEATTPTSFAPLRRAREMHRVRVLERHRVRVREAGAA